MIKALLLDIDGVIIGQRTDYNYPLPHAEVAERLQRINAAGIPVHLITGRATFSMKPIIEPAGLNHLHISDAGAVISNPLSNEVTSMETIEQSIAVDASKKLIEHGIYTEWYYLNNYFIQKDQLSPITQARSQIYQRTAETVDHLSSIEENPIRVNAITRESKQIETVNEILEVYTDHLHVSWTMHPSMPNEKVALITKKDVSKDRSSLALAKAVNLDLSETLGVGDNPSDWQFMQYCGHKATLKSANETLKEMIQEASGYIGDSVDSNGILDILDHFELPK